MSFSHASIIVEIVIILIQNLFSCSSNIDRLNAIEKALCEKFYLMALMTVPRTFVTVPPKTYFQDLSQNGRSYNRFNPISSTNNIIATIGVVYHQSLFLPHLRPATHEMPLIQSRDGRLHANSNHGNTTRPFIF